VRPVALDYDAVATVENVYLLFYSYFQFPVQHDTALNSVVSNELPRIGTCIVLAVKNLKRHLVQVRRKEVIDDSARRPADVSLALSDDRTLILIVGIEKRTDWCAERFRNRQ